MITIRKLARIQWRQFDDSDELQQGYFDVVVVGDVAVVQFEIIRIYLRSQKGC